MPGQVAQSLPVIRPLTDTEQDDRVALTTLHRASQPS